MISYPITFRVCPLDLAERNLRAILVGSTIQLPDDLTGEERQAVVDFLTSATPCSHSAISAEQRAASDEWAALNAKLAALPVDPEYDAIRTRLTSELATALERAEALGGLA